MPKHLQTGSLKTINGETLEGTGDIVITGGSGGGSKELPAYSTDEVLTAERWKDGKPLYKKTIEFGALPNNTTKTVAHNISNMETYWVDVTNTFGARTGESVPVPLESGDTGAGVNLYATTTSLIAKTTKNWSIYSCTATIKYTKTTDTASSPVALIGGAFDYYQASNPTINTNGSVNDLWFNTTTMELFICRDATVGANVWEGDKGTIISGASIIYGVEWNPSTDTYTRTGKAVGTPVSTSYAGAIQTKMKRCVLNANGTVKYYLHPTNSTKKADGTAAIIDGSDGNVMVQIPKFYYKYENVSGVHKWSIATNPTPGYEVHPAFIRSGVEKNYRYYPAYEGYNLGGRLISGSGRTPTVSQTIATFRTQAAANGAGWSQIDWNLLTAVQLLFLTEYADFDTQAMIGNGNYTGDDYTMTTGGSNSIGNASSPATNDDTWISYRGIENWYASTCKFIDGVNVSERVYYVNNNPATFADDVFTGDYVSTGITSVDTDGYVSNLVASGKGFVPSAVDGSSSTYVPDYFWQNTGNTIVVFGGAANHGMLCGGFYLYAYYASSITSPNFGSAVAF